MRYLPFTFLSGAHGFALFAPYLIAVMAFFFIRRRRREPLPVPIPVPVPVSSSSD